MKNLIYILLLSLTFTSCNKFLNVDPKTQIDSEVIFETEEGFESALLECYYRMSDDATYGKSFTIAEIDGMAQLWTLTYYTVATAKEVSEFNYEDDAVKTFFSNSYGKFYNIIAQANDVLAHLETKGDVIGDETTRMLIEAEALAIRAYVHFDIFRLFGEMPNNGTKKVSLSYTEEIGINAANFIPRGEYIAKLNADLNRAEEIMAQYDPVAKNGLAQGEIDDFSDLFVEYRRYRMNYYALLGLRARVALYFGEDAEALEYAKKVINAKTTEGILGVELSGQTDVEKGFYTMPSETLFSLSKSGLHKNYSDLTNYNAYPAMLTALYGSSIVEDIRAVNLWTLGTTTSYINKYDFPTAQTEIDPTGHQLVPMVRLAEMYLIAAELSPLNEANSYYRALLLSRNVVKAETITDANRYDLLKLEYAKEFYGEGQLFYFYKRNGAPKMDVGTIANDLNENKYIVPLPDSELGMLN